jgi:enamine deaminase RidA (YjgF/YER057c/UK114 family)
VLIEQRIEALGLTLPRPMQAPTGMRLPYASVLVRGDRAYVAGHGPVTPDGVVAGPFGKVGREVSLEQAHASVRLTALAILGDLARALGDLDRITAWLRVFGMVNAEPGFGQEPAVINGFSDLILEVFGPEVGAHARSAVGMADLPFNIPVEIEAELQIRSQT